MSVGLKKAFLGLEQITHHIAGDNPEAATRTAEQVYVRIEELVTFPHRGRLGRKEGTRELVLTSLPYIVVYRVKESTIEILQIRHGAQNAN